MQKSIEYSHIFFSICIKNPLIWEFLSSLEKHTEKNKKCFVYLYLPITYMPQLNHKCIFKHAISRKNDYLKESVYQGKGISVQITHDSFTLRHFFCKREEEKSQESDCTVPCVERDGIQLTVLSQSPYSRRNASIQRLCVCCVRADVGGISWRLSFMVMIPSGSCEGCFQVPCIRLLLSQSISLSAPRNRPHAHTLSTEMSHISLFKSSES